MQLGGDLRFQRGIEATIENNAASRREPDDAALVILDAAGAVSVIGIGKARQNIALEAIEKLPPAIVSRFQRVRFSFKTRQERLRKKKLIEKIATTSKN